VRVLYFTGAYRTDSMVSHTHGELVAALRARGVAMEIATVGARDQDAAVVRETDTFGTTVWRIQSQSGPMDRFRRAASARVWAYPPYLGLVGALRRFLTPERVRQYDLVHIGMAYPYATAFRHALHGRQTPPALVTITGGDVLTEDETGYGYGRLPTTRRAIQRTLRWAALVQANSPHSARVVASYGCPAERIAVQPPHSAHTPLPTDAIPAYRGQSRTTLEADGVLVPGGRLLIGLGRMVPIKGFDDVIRALPGVVRAYPETTVLFAGPARDAEATAYAASLEQLASDYGVRDHVRIVGQIPYESVPVYFAAADLALVPSLIDGLNMTAIEAGAVGTPSIVSEKAGVADYIRMYSAGRTVPHRDPRALEAAILDLMGSGAAWQAAATGATRMAGAFALAPTADGVLRLYERALRA
jgi:teichuronic acid biosynthesis glycosyltransferase TuaC